MFESIVSTAAPFVTTVDNAFWLYIAGYAASCMLILVGSEPVYKAFFHGVFAKNKNEVYAAGVYFGAFVVANIALLVACFWMGAAGTVTAIVWTTLLYIPFAKMQTEWTKSLIAKTGAAVAKQVYEEESAAAV